MASPDKEDRSLEDLTEEASSHRLEELRQKGQIPQSKELNTVLSIFGGLVGFYFFCAYYFQTISVYMRHQFELFSFFQKKNTHELIFNQNIFYEFVKVFLLLSSPMSFLLILFAVIGSIYQVGPLFTLEPLQFDLSRIDFIKGIKKIFSKNIFFEIFRNFIKVLSFFCLLFFFIKASAYKFPVILWFDVFQTLHFLQNELYDILIYFFCLAFLFAGVDVFFQKRQFSKSVRMTKQEAKQEAKDREGDPQIKSRMRSIARQMARRRMMNAVKTATVVVTNPTHIAVALFYDKNNMNSPRVVAKGADLIAQKIKEVAKNANVPLVENIPLARELYKKVKLGGFIPNSLYQAVAEVLVFVYKIRGRKF